MRLSAAIRDYLIEIEIRKYTPKTIKGYRTNLGLFLRFCEEMEGVDTLEDLTPAIVRQFAKYMADRGRKGTYINGLLKSIKSFTQYCYDEGMGGFNTKRNFKWCKEEKPVIIAFKPEHVRAMLNDCGGGDFIAVRDRAVLTMLFETGIRCWELCCMRPEDIHEDFIVIANGKGHKQRVVPITAILYKAMIKYERVRDAYFSLKTTDNNYFLSFHGRQLTNSAVEHIVKRHGSWIEGIMKLYDTLHQTYGGFTLDTSKINCNHSISEKNIELLYDGPLQEQFAGANNPRIYFNVQASHGAKVLLLADRPDGKRVRASIEASEDEG